MKGWKDEILNERWKNERMKVWMKEWMDEWMNESIND